MSHFRFAAVILAAGGGTRMNSALPKVMHKIAGRPMILHLLAALEPLRPAETVVVLAPGMAEVARAVAPACCVVQDPPQGTGDAVRAACPVLASRLVPAGDIAEVLVLYGDTPLLESESLSRLLRARRDSGATVAAAGMRPADPGPYGRHVLGPGGMLEQIIEAADAGAPEAASGLYNGGIMAIDGRWLFALIDALDRNNSKGEFYLTDIVRAARQKGLPCRAVELPAEQLVGVNTRAELAAAEALMQRRVRARDGGGGHAGRAGDGVSLCRYAAWPRRRRRAPCRLRPRRHGRRRGADPRLFASRRGADRQGRRDRPVRPAASGVGPGRGGAYRQFRRGQGGPPRQGRQGQPPLLSRRCRNRRRHEYRRRHDHLQLRRL